MITTFAFFLGISILFENIIDLIYIQINAQQLHIDIGRKKTDIF